MDKCFSQEITLSNLQVLCCLAGCHNNVFPSPPSFSLSFLPVGLVKIKRSVVNCCLNSGFPPMNKTGSSGKKVIGVTLYLSVRDVKSFNHGISVEF